MSDAIPKASGIYKITCTATGKIYIGSTVDLRKRKRDHFRMLRQNKHDNQYLQHAWNKYGEQAFTFEVLDYNILPISLTAREQYWFNKLKPFGRKGFNLAPEAGSTLGVKPTPETIEKMRQTRIGKTLSPETIEKVRQFHLGRKRSPETCEKIRRAAIGRVASPELREKRRQNALGKKQTPETIEKTRQFLLGRKQSPEHIEKSRVARLGKASYKRTPETIEKNRKASLGNKHGLGKKHMPETIEKIRRAQIGREFTPEHREKIRQGRLAYFARKRQANSEVPI